MRDRGFGEIVKAARMVVAHLDPIMDRPQVLVGVAGLDQAEDSFPIDQGFRGVDIVLAEKLTSVNGLPPWGPLSTNSKMS